MRCHKFVRITSQSVINVIDMFWTSRIKSTMFLAGNDWISAKETEVYFLSQSLAKRWYYGNRSIITNIVNIIFCKLEQPNFKWSSKESSLSHSIKVIILGLLRVQNNADNFLFSQRFQKRWHFYILDRSANIFW